MQALTYNEILTFEISDLKKVGQDCIFVFALTMNEILTFGIFELERYFKVTDYQVQIFQMLISH